MWVVVAPAGSGGDFLRRPTNGIKSLNYPRQNFGYSTKSRQCKIMISSIVPIVSLKMAITVKIVQTDALKSGVIAAEPLPPQGFKQQEEDS